MSSARPISERRQRLFKVLVPLLASVLTLVVLEAALALFHPVPFSIETNMYFQADPYTGYRLKPGGVGHYQMGIPAVANSHGHRDVEVGVKKPAGVLRILAIGDSFTVGANVRQEEAYPKVLERELRREYGDRIQVVNSAVGGWDPFQYAEYYLHEGYRFEPDLILVGFFVGNDTFDPNTSPARLNTAIRGHTVSREAASRRTIDLEVFLYDHSNLARALLNRGPVAEDSFLRRRCDDFSDWYLAVQTGRLPNHLRDAPAQREKARNAVDQIRRIRDAAAGIPLVVALLPDENQINPSLQQRLIPAAEMPKYDFDMPQSMLAEMFRDRAIPTIDLLPAVRAERRCLYMNDTHWTPEGHVLAASVIRDGLSPTLARIKSAK